jgi:hypothetical protein
LRPTVQRFFATTNYDALDPGASRESANAFRTAASMCDDAPAGWLVVLTNKQ